MGIAPIFCETFRSVSVKRFAKFRIISETEISRNRFRVSVQTLHLDNLKVSMILLLGPRTPRDPRRRLQGRRIHPQSGYYYYHLGKTQKKVFLKVFSPPPLPRLSGHRNFFFYIKKSSFFLVAHPFSPPPSEWPGH